MDNHKFHIKAGHINPDNDQPVECHHCGWKGTIIDCDRQRIRENDHVLAQREGYSWTCPVCETEVWKYYYLVS